MSSLDVPQELPSQWVTIRVVKARMIESTSQKHVCKTLGPRVTSGPRAQCTVRPNKTKRSEFGAEQGSLQGRARRLVIHALETLDSPTAFSKALF